MRHLVVVPARNEARFIEDMLRSLLGQTEPPDRIVVVDDGSWDDTVPIVAAVAARNPRVLLLQCGARNGEVMGPAVVRAFRLAYDQAGGAAYRYVSKLDADLLFPERYCETVLAYLEAHPDVGVSGGVIEEEASDRAAPSRVAPNHVAGALQTFRQTALAAIGGLAPVPGWDIVDQVKLRVLGWRTAALQDLPVLHRRAHGARNGRVLGKAEWGRGAWVIRSHPLFVFARGLYRMLEPPYVISGLAFWGGYLVAALRRVPRLDDPPVVAQLRQEQLYRLRAWNRSPQTAHEVEAARGRQRPHTNGNAKGRIAIFWNYLFHYRVPFYERLARAPGVHLTVFHGGGDPNSRRHEPVVNSHAFRSVQIRTYEKWLWGAAVYFQVGMWKHLLRDRYDVIVCEGNFGILSNTLIALYARLTGARVYFWAGGWERNVIAGFPARLRRLYIRLTSRLANGYLCYGSNARAFLAKYGVDETRCTVVQNTIDTEGVQARLPRFRSLAAETRASLGLDGKLVILSVGVLIPRKRHDLLIEAFRSIRAARSDVALVIVGDGPEMSRLVTLVAEQGIPDVYFAGEVVAEAGRYFAMADVFVLPSLGGLAINEAMAYALPVICSEGDGTERDLVIPGRTGVFFRKNDRQDLADKLSQLLASATERTVMGELARDHVYRVASMSSMVSRFLAAVGARG
ncbi:MAG TPA: glycosyltransferase [Gemmatimonadales bacterium]|jgi:glycosyltransferase involved in cell wall biosynthesis